MKNIKEYIWDFVVIFILILFIGIFIFWTLIDKNSSSGSASKVIISVNSRIEGEYPLNMDREVIVDNSYGRNVIIIKDGKVSVFEADCPSHECIDTGPIFRNKESIVCLPHRLVVYIDNQDESDYDTIAY